MMLGGVVPGVVLILAAFSVEPQSSGGYFLRYFNFLSGIFIVIYNYLEYRKPGVLKQKIGADMALVLSGLLVIAQGASSFDPAKGFQPAHLLFLAGSFSIFKGVMFPEAKIRRGFVITGEKVFFRTSLFSKTISINTSDLNSITREKDVITFSDTGNNQTKIDLSGYQNAEEIYHDLQRFVTVAETEKV